MRVRSCRSKSKQNNRNCDTEMHFENKFQHSILDSQLKIWPEPKFKSTVAFECSNSSDTSNGFRCTIQLQLMYKEWFLKQRVNHVSFLSFYSLDNVAKLLVKLRLKTLLLFFKEFSFKSIYSCGTATFQGKSLVTKVRRVFEVEFTQLM